MFLSAHAQASRHCSILVPGLRIRPRALGLQSFENGLTTFVFCEWEENWCEQPGDLALCNSWPQSGRLDGSKGINLQSLVESQLLGEFMTLAETGAENARGTMSELQSSFLLQPCVRNDDVGKSATCSDLHVSFVRGEWKRIGTKTDEAHPAHFGPDGQGFGGLC